MASTPRRPLSPPMQGSPRLPSPGYRPAAKSSTRPNTIVSKNAKYMRDHGIHDTAIRCMLLADKWGCYLELAHKYTNLRDPRILVAETDMVDLIQCIFLLLVEEDTELRNDAWPCFDKFVNDDMASRLVETARDNHPKGVLTEVLRGFAFLFRRMRCKDALSRAKVAVSVASLVQLCVKNRRDIQEDFLADLIYNLSRSLTKQTKHVSYFFAAGELEQRHSQSPSALPKSLHKRTPPSFPMFEYMLSVLTHSDGVGERARRSISDIIAVSTKDELLQVYLLNHSNVCMLIGACLPAVFSQLPPSLSSPWPTPLRPSDIDAHSALKDFMAFMAFIDTLFFVAPVPIVDALVLQIDQCFLTNALLPFFFQESADPIFVSTRLFQYILKSIKNQRFLSLFLHFVCTAVHNDTHFHHSLLNRMQLESPVGFASLQLIHSLIDRACEDVMIALVFQPLLSGNHASPATLIDAKPGRQSLIDSARHFLALSSSLMQQSQPDASFPQYLNEAHSYIQQTRRACKEWSRSYTAEEVLSSADYDAMPFNPAPFWTSLFNLLGRALHLTPRFLLATTGLVASLCRFPHCLLLNYTLNTQFRLKDGVPSLFRTLQDVYAEAALVREPNESAFVSQMTQARSHFEDIDLDAINPAVSTLLLDELLKEMAALALEHALAL